MLFSTVFPRLIFELYVSINLSERTLCRLDPSPSSPNGFVMCIMLLTEGKCCFPKVKFIHCTLNFCCDCCLLKLLKLFVCQLSLENYLFLLSSSYLKDYQLYLRRLAKIRCQCLVATDCIQYP